MKKSLCFFVMCFFLAVPAFLSAQTAAEIDDLLSTKAVSYGQAARFVLKAADVSELLDTAAAFRFAEERQWLPGNVSSDDGASLKGVSLLIMRSFGIKGGLFYSAFKSPHYAYREMVYQDIIQGKADPDMAVSGNMLLFLVGRILSRQETAVQQSPPQPAADQQAIADKITGLLADSSVTDATVRITEEGVTISLSNMQFPANSSELPESEKAKLMEVAEILKNIPQRKILVSGHTALAGTPEDRVETSYQRARAVADYLVSQGVRQAEEITAKGFGADRPIADNGTPEGMNRNRRVEITILENQQ